MARLAIALEVLEIASHGALCVFICVIWEAIFVIRNEGIDNVNSSEHFKVPICLVILAH